MWFFIGVIVGLCISGLFVNRFLQDKLAIEKEQFMLKCSAGAIFNETDVYSRYLRPLALELHEAYEANIQLQQSEDDDLTLRWLAGKIPEKERSFWRAVDFFGDLGFNPRNFWGMSYQDYLPERY